MTTGFIDCEQCKTGRLQITAGFGALPPDDDTEVEDMGDGWLSGDLKVIPVLVLHCDHCDFKVAGHGMDADGNGVEPLPGNEVTQVMTDPSMIIVDDERVEEMLNNGE